MILDVQPAGKRAFDHVLVIMFENQYRAYVMRNQYMRNLARQGIDLRASSSRRRIHAAKSSQSLNSSNSSSPIDFRRTRLRRVQSYLDRLVPSRVVYESPRMTQAIAFTRTGPGGVAVDRSPGPGRAATFPDPRSNAR